MPSQSRSTPTFLQTAGEKAFAVMNKPGWPRRILLAVAALVLILAGLSLRGGPGYKNDPSALTPRSVQLYMETGELDSLLKTTATWRLWKADRRAKGDEHRNQLQVDLASIIGSHVAGLGTRLPLQWLVDTKQAAYCVNKDEQGNESWALFLAVGGVPQAMADIGVEPGMNIEQISGTAEQGVFKLTGTGAGELYFGALEPWLIISSQPTLPQFALESSRRPAFSLARAELLPAWRRGVVVRGIVNPVSQADVSATGAYSVLSGWMDPDMRVSFTSKIGSKGLETLLDANQLSERVSKGGLWPLFAILLAILGLIALAVIVLTLLTMIGWGGWLKSAAMRAGVLPARGPVPVVPSAAFVEDSGAARETPAPAPEPVPASIPAPAPAAQESSKTTELTAEQTAKLAETQAPDAPPASIEEQAGGHEAEEKDGEVDGKERDTHNSN